MSHRRVLAAAERLRIPLAPPPPTTALGALVAHVTGGTDSSLFQPMNVDFGLFPPLDDARGGRRGGGAVQGVYGPGEDGFCGVAGAGGVEA